MCKIELGEKLELGLNQKQEVDLFWVIILPKIQKRFEMKRPDTIIEVGWMSTILLLSVFKSNKGLSV